MPKVSIVIPSFNHEPYIRECIHSALDQTFQDFEIVVTDDGSSDRSVEAVKEFHDTRLRLYAHATNRGACAALNDCIRKATGEYIAVLNSDDAWEPTKLEKQVLCLEEHPDRSAVFTWVNFIGQSGDLLSDRDLGFFYIFDKDNRPRSAWLKQFFSEGNCLCHPSILIRKKCYDEMGLYDERMASLPDMDMWVRLCLRHEIHVLPERLVRFRVRGEANASGDKPSNHIRGQFEYMQILNHYLTIKDEQFLLEIFPDAAKYGRAENSYIPYFLGRLAMDVSGNLWHLWGLEVLNNFLGDSAVAKEVEEKYAFRYRDFYGLTGRYDVFNIVPARKPEPPAVLPPAFQFGGMSAYIHPQSKLGRVVSYLGGLVRPRHHPRKSQIEAPQ